MFTTAPSSIMHSSQYCTQTHHNIFNHNNRAGKEPHWSRLRGPRRRCQPLRLGNSHHGTGRHFVRGRILQSQITIPPGFPQHAPYHDILLWYVAPQCIQGWKSLHFHPSSTRWRCDECARERGWEMETNFRCWADPHLGHFHAKWSEWWESSKFGCGCAVEEWQARLQKEGATNCQEESGYVLVTFVSQTVQWFVSCAV